MLGRSDDGRGDLLTRHPRIAKLAIMLAICAALSGCDSERIVTTDGAPPTAQVTAPVPPAPSTRATNEGLAKAFDFYSQPGGSTGYYFTSPSKRWVCAIIPREKAGCQSSTGSRIAITGAPDSVLDAQGEDAAPNAIQVDRGADAQFVSVDAPGFSLVPGPATVLPFNEILTVAGFRCNVQEATGISCLDEQTGKGFTFDADGYAFVYTDLPA